MSKILLIDADSKIPNIALMKIGMFHKLKGDQVNLVKCNLPYYPNRKKHIFQVPPDYDKKYCSVIFEGNKEFIIGSNIIFGGTGVDLKTVLLDEIDRMDVDYSFYPENDISYGFITRGCIRRCYFCKVPKKEGMIHKVSNIDKIIKHKKVKFLDNNILAFPGHIEILEELVQKNIKHQFNQGLDIRLLKKDNSYLLSKLNYLGEYIFAFDNWKYKQLIEDKIKLLDWRKDWQLKFFVYVHPKMTIYETVSRIKYIKKMKCLVYIMRDINCWSTKYCNFFIDIAAYCNQVNFFKKINFESFLKKRHKRIERIKESLWIWNENY